MMERELALEAHVLLHMGQRWEIDEAIWRDADPSQP